MTDKLDHGEGCTCGCQDEKDEEMKITREFDDGENVLAVNGQTACFHAHFHTLLYLHVFVFIYISVQGILYRALAVYPIRKEQLCTCSAPAAKRTLFPADVRSRDNALKDVAFPSTKGL